jgi:urocanate hydratase
MNNQDIAQAMKIQLTTEDIPKKQLVFQEGIRRAPKRDLTLTAKEMELALHNALRYIPQEYHTDLASEFLAELMSRGRIYGYRFRPDGNIQGKPIHEYLGQCEEGRAIQVMIDNNLDFDIALYPYELVTYGETGQVCQNWMQYLLIKKYLQQITCEQTLVIASGHPLGLFKSNPYAPRVIITNGLMVGLFDDLSNWNRAAALGVSNYGQMTAGGWMYIGPQGIVHGTYSTILNAGRLFCGVPENGDLSGKLFVSSGLGGMSGAQGKACMIAGGACIIAEVDLSRIQTRHQQGWVSEVTDSPQIAFESARKYLEQQKPCAIAFHGNIIDLLEYAVTHQEKIDLLSDQTSCHAVYDGGYCPHQITFAERTRLLEEDKQEFCRLVNNSLKQHYTTIRTLAERGAYFFDYGNSFLKAVYDAGVKEISKNGRDDKDGFIYPSYVEDILGPELFDWGYGPFRWVCLSGKKEDLQKTDQAALALVDPDRRYQDRDNYVWIRDAEKHQLVVGTQARIFYQDAMSRTKIALKFNDMVRKGEVGPIMLGRDHHDVSGTDSPFRETSNIKDGSNIMADMATHCFAGNAARGMTMVALHNGGGVGIGKSINGGFGMLLDGSSHVDTILQQAMPWDVMSGVARRSWARNKNALQVCMEYNQQNEANDQITLPFLADSKMVEDLVRKKLSP